MCEICRTIASPSVIARLDGVQQRDVFTLDDSDVLLTINRENRMSFCSYEFFNDLYHRFLSTPKVEMKCMCLQAMSIVYGRYFEDIGPFADTKYIVQMLDRVCLLLLFRVLS